MSARSDENHLISVCWLASLTPPTVGAIGHARGVFLPSPGGTIFARWVLKSQANDIRRDVFTIIDFLRFNRRGAERIALAAGYSGYDDFACIHCSTSCSGTVSTGTSLKRDL